MVQEIVVAEEDQTMEWGSMLARYCAAQAGTTEETDIDVEIDQYLTAPPSNYDFLESYSWLVIDFKYARER